MSGISPGTRVAQRHVDHSDDARALFAEAGAAAFTANKRLPFEDATGLAD